MKKAKSWKAGQSLDITRPSEFNSWRHMIMTLRRRESAKAVAKAVKKGIIPPAKTLDCVDCGEPAQCYEHRDYNYPMMVDPVCKRCDCNRGPGYPFYDEKSKEYRSLLRKTKDEYSGVVELDARALAQHGLNDKQIKMIKGAVKFILKHSKP